MSQGLWRKVQVRPVRREEQKESWRRSSTEVDGERIHVPREYIRAQLENTNLPTVRAPAQAIKNRASQQPPEPELNSNEHLWYKHLTLNGKNKEKNKTVVLKYDCTTKKDWGD